MCSTTVTELGIADLPSHSQSRCSLHFWVELLTLITMTSAQVWMCSYGRDKAVFSSECSFWSPAVMEANAVLKYSLVSNRENHFIPSLWPAVLDSVVGSVFLQSVRQKVSVEVLSHSIWRCWRSFLNYSPERTMSAHFFSICYSLSWNFLQSPAASFLQTPAGITFV